MKRLVLFVLVLLLASHKGGAQEAKPLPAADERYKADILLVVAHPDDEGAATPYLARAIYDEHKRVAVVFTTRGGSGGNDYSREHGPALADIREQEARQAWAAAGVRDAGDRERMVSRWERHRVAERVEFVGELGARRKFGSARANRAANQAGGNHKLAAEHFHRRKPRRP